MSFSEDLSRSELTVEQFAKIMTRIQQMTPPTDDDAITDWGIISPLVDEHDLSITVGSADIDVSELSEYANNDIPYSFYTPSGSYPYPLSHTLIGTMTFPNSGKKFAANCQNAGDAYIQISHDSWMDVAALNNAFAFWTKKTSTGTYSIFCKKDISSDTLAGIHIYISGTTISCRISDGTNTALLQGTLSTLNDGNWHSCIINIPASGNLEIFIDAVSRGTVSRGSVASLNNTRDCYLQAEDNAGTIQNKLVSNSGVFIWKKNEIFSSSQITDFENGYYDLTNQNTSKDIEILTMPYWASEVPMPNITAGRFTPD